MKILEDLKTRCNHANNTMALTKISHGALFRLNHHGDNLLSKTLGIDTVCNINAIFDTAEEAIKNESRHTSRQR